MSSEINSEKNSQSLSLKDLPRPQKIAVGFLSVLAISIVVFWVWQMRVQVNKPFDYDVKPATTASSTDIAQVLKQRDTDNDGLSDYDEIYTYKTSPYLEDSDSDGISDKKEVEQGTDPNCPQGKNCVSPDAAATSTITITPEDIFPTSSEALLPPELSIGSSTLPELQNALSGKADMATIRKLLISSGANKADLDKINDTDLMKIYKESLKNSGATSTNSNINNQNIK